MPVSAARCGNSVLFFFFLQANGLQSHVWLKSRTCERRKTANLLRRIETFIIFAKRLMRARRDRGPCLVGNAEFHCTSNGRREQQQEVIKWRRSFSFFATPLSPHSLCCCTTRGSIFFLFLFFWLLFFVCVLLFPFCKKVQQKLDMCVWTVGHKVHFIEEKFTKVVEGKIPNHRQGLSLSLVGYTPDTFQLINCLVLHDNFAVFLSHRYETLIKQAICRFFYVDRKKPNNVDTCGMSKQVYKLGFQQLN